MPLLASPPRLRTTRRWYVLYMSTCRRCFREESAHKEHLYPQGLQEIAASLCARLLQHLPPHDLDECMGQQLGQIAYLLVKPNVIMAWSTRNGMVHLTVLTLPLACAQAVQMAQLGRPGPADQIFGLLGCTHRLLDKLMSFAVMQRPAAHDSGPAHAQPCVLSLALPGVTASLIKGPCAMHTGCLKHRPDWECGTQVRCLRPLRGVSRPAPRSGHRPATLTPAPPSLRTTTAWCPRPPGSTRQQQQISPCRHRESPWSVHHAQYLHTCRMWSRQMLSRQPFGPCMQR